MQKLQPNVTESFRISSNSLNYSVTQKCTKLLCLQDNFTLHI